MAEAAAGDVRRRALTTVADLADRIELVRAASERAGRPRDAVAVSTQIWFTAYGSAEQVREAETALAANWAGLPGHPLCRSPYLLFGSPAQMAEALLERAAAYGLERISLKESGDSPYAPDPIRDRRGTRLKAQVHALARLLLSRLLCSTEQLLNISSPVEATGRAGHERDDG